MERIIPKSQICSIKMYPSGISYAYVPICYKMLKNDSCFLQANSSFRTTEFSDNYTSDFHTFSVQFDISRLSIKPFDWQHSNTVSGNIFFCSFQQFLLVDLKKLIQKAMFCHPFSQIRRPSIDHCYFQNT